MKYFFNFMGIFNLGFMIENMVGGGDPRLSSLHAFAGCFCLWATWEHG